MADASADTVPDAHDTSKRHAPIMITDDMVVMMDPTYKPIAQRFLENSDHSASNRPQLKCKRQPLLCRTVPRAFDLI